VDKGHGREGKSRSVSATWEGKRGKKGGAVKCITLLPSEYKKREVARERRRNGLFSPDCYTTPKNLGRQ